MKLFHRLKSCVFVSAIAAIAILAAPQRAIAQTPPDAPMRWQPQEGPWQPVPARREDYGKIKVVWLQGTPYEMGYQHGTLLHDEIASMGRPVIDSLNFFGRGLALGRLARKRSFPDVVEECQGLVAATADLGLTLEGCMVLALGDVYQEYFTYLAPNILFNDGCAHFIAFGKATADGRMYHGWTLDNDGSPIPYWIENPTILVRQPDDGIPHVFITVPGMVWPNAGFNAEGIIVSNNTSHPRDYGDLSLQGKSTIQIMARVAKYARNYEEAYAIMNAYERMRSNLVIVSDAKSERAGIFELLGQEMGVRELNEEGLLYMTNHFVTPEVEGRDSNTESSFNRFRSFQQLLEPNGSRSHYGR
ncbi:MAG: C45 family autoproteolytic acyltransferase/hydrolase, partial [Spirulina sp.]